MYKIFVYIYLKILYDVCTWLRMAHTMEPMAKKIYKGGLVVEFASILEHMFSLIRWTQVKILGKQWARNFSLYWKFITNPLNILKCTESESKIKNNDWTAKVRNLATD